MNATNWLVVAILAAASAAPLNAQGQRMDGRATRVDSLFAQWDRSSSPGCSVAISRNGTLTYERGYGMSNLEDGIAITPATVLEVGSMSKQFTAASILLLQQRRQLSLDDDVRKYIPELPDYGTRITLRHLITHTSGLRDVWDLLSMAGWRDFDLVTQDDALGLVIRQKALEFTPGERYGYSNTGFILLAIVVNRVSGQSFRAFTDSAIFGPLGMTHTHFRENHTGLVPNRALAYVGGKESWQTFMTTYDAYGADGLFTTAEDMLRWEQNFVDGRVGGPELARAMQTPNVVSNGDTTSYGVGLFIRHYRGVPVFSHDGASYGYVANAMRFPDQGVAVAVLCNARNIDAVDFPIESRTSTSAIFRLLPPRLHSPRPSRCQRNN